MRKTATSPLAPQPPEPARWFIYMVRTAAGPLYTGISTDPQRRLRQHQRGAGSRALRGKGPLTLVWQQEIGDKGAALRIEYRLKQQPKTFKEQLIRSPELWLSWSPQWLSTAMPC